MRSTDIQTGQEYRVLERPQAFGNSTNKGFRAKVLAIVERTNKRGHPNNVEVEYTDERLPTLEEYTAAQRNYARKSRLDRFKRANDREPNKEERTTILAEVEEDDFVRPRTLYRGRTLRVYSGRIDCLWTLAEAEMQRHRAEREERTRQQQAEHDRIVGQLQADGFSVAQIERLTHASLRGDLLTDNSRFSFTLDEIRAFFKDEEVE